MWGLDGSDERLSFGKEVRRQAEYGTSSSSRRCATKRDETKYLKHAVVPGDTLQGLSLKYNVPIEHIKRANKLWTNDSLFPRKFLLIPSCAVDGCVDNISLSSDCSSILSGQSTSATDPRPRSFDRHLSEGAEVGVDDVRVEVEPDDMCSVNDYFSKMDSKIRVVKENVSKLESRSRSGPHPPAVFLEKLIAGHSWT